MTKISAPSVFICAMLSFLASFMPIVSNQNFHLHMQDLGGFFYIIYLIPLLIVGVVLLSSMGKLNHIKRWLIPIATFGLILTLFSTHSGTGYVAAFTSNAGSYGAVDYSNVQAVMSYGPALNLFAYAGSIIFSFYLSNKH